MNLDTPLTEVADHLSVESAGLISDCPPDIQTLMLERVRIFVVALEGSGAGLDPITYNRVVDAYVQAELPHVIVHLTLLTRMVNIRALSVLP